MLSGWLSHKALGGPKDVLLVPDISSLDWTSSVEQFTLARSSRIASKISDGELIRVIIGGLDWSWLVWVRGCSLGLFEGSVHTEL